MIAMTALIALIRKDILLFVSDRRALLLTLVMPIVLGAFMGSVFGGGGKSENAKIKVALVLEDKGEIANAISTGLKNEPTLVLSELPLAEARDLVRTGKLNAAIVIPAGFGEAAGAALFSGKGKPVLPIYYDPSQSVALAIVKGALTQYVMQAVSKEMIGGKGGQTMIKNSLSQLEGAGEEANEVREFLASLQKFQGTQAKANTSQSGGGMSVPFSTKDEEVTSGVKFNGYGHSFAGMAVQFILMMSIDIGVGILLARRMGMWNRLLAAPISLNTILMARAISGALIGTVLMCVIFIAAMLLFKLQITNPLGFLGIAACFASMTAMFGLFIASFGKTPEASRGIAVFATLIMVMLGGAWIPSFLFPEWVQSLTLFIPTRWAIDGLGNMTWRGLGLDSAFETMSVLMAFTLAFGSIAFWKFNRDGQQQH